MKINKNTILKIIFLLSFLVLILIIFSVFNDSKVNENRNQTNKEEEKVNEIKINIYEKLNQNKYSFIVNSNINNYEKYITGRVNKNTVNVTIDNETIIRNIGDFNTIDDMFKYINIDTLKLIIDLASINSKNDNIITYDIDVIDLLDIYNSEIEYDSFTFDSTDKIIITFENNYIKKIDLDYSNYFKFIDHNNTNFNINIEYNY